MKPAELRKLRTALRRELLRIADDRSAAYFEVGQEGARGQPGRGQAVAVETELCRCLEAMQAVHAAREGEAFSPRPEVAVWLKERELA